MVPGLEMMACPNLAVPAAVMQHVVNVESSRNPFAIGVVGGQLVRQPQNLPEAVATVRMLESKGYNYSLGVAQVNRTNLGKFGLDSYEKSFDYCPNLVAGSQILAQCYASAGGDWGKAFSCYYSGNFTTGYQDGYVQKIFQSMAQQPVPAGALPIPLQPTKVPARVTRVGKGITGIKTDDPAYRVAMRSVLDATANAFVNPAVAAATGSALAQNTPTLPAGGIDPLPALPGQSTPSGRIPTAPSIASAMDAVGAPAPDAPTNTQPGRIATDPATAAAMAQIGSAPAAQDPNGVFVPQVRGPGDTAPAQAAPAVDAAPAVPAGPRVDQADLRNGGGDGAFVF